jgi:hypothetical protein
MSALYLLFCEKKGERKQLLDRIDYPNFRSLFRTDAPLRLDQPSGSRLDHRLGAGRRAELCARIVDVEVDGALG